MMRLVKDRENEAVFGGDNYFKVLFDSVRKKYARTSGELENLQDYVVPVLAKKSRAINDGNDFYNYLQNSVAVGNINDDYNNVVNLFLKYINDLKTNEEIISVLDSTQTFHILVPFVPYGEFVGVFYMKNKPNFEFITEEILSSYDEVALILQKEYRVSLNRVMQEIRPSLKYFVQYNSKALLYLADILDVPPKKVPKTL